MSATIGQLIAEMRRDASALYVFDPETSTLIRHYASRLELIAMAEIVKDFGDKLRAARVAEGET